MVKQIEWRSFTRRIGDAKYSVDDFLGYFVAQCIDDQAWKPEPFETVEEAQAACQKHADAQGRIEWYCVEDCDSADGVLANDLAEIWHGSKYTIMRDMGESVFSISHESDSKLTGEFEDLAAAQEACQGHADQREQKP